MNVRSTVGSFQLPVAGIGALVCVGAVSAVLSMPSAEGEGFVRGLAVLVLYGVAWLGFVLTALGLAIPPADGVGIRFRTWQRRLFVTAAALGVLGGVSPLLFWPVVATTALSFNTVALAWVAVVGLAVLSLVAGLAWRAGEAAWSVVGPRAS